MKTKRILRFYFRYERTEQMLDRLILKRAACGGGYTAERCAERVIEAIEKKRLLCEFWLHLDGVMRSFCEEERAVLKNYALSSGAVDKRRARVLVAGFTRKARAGLDGVRGGLEVLREYLVC